MDNHREVHDAIADAVISSTPSQSGTDEDVFSGNAESQANPLLVGSSAEAADPQADSSVGVDSSTLPSTCAPSRRCGKKYLARGGCCFLMVFAVLAVVYLGALHLGDPVDPVAHCVVDRANRTAIHIAVAYSERIARGEAGGKQISKNHAMLHRHRPLVLFDSAEEYYPLAAEDFIANSSLMHGSDVLIAYPNLTSEDIARASVEFHTETFRKPEDHGYVIKPIRSSYGGSKNLRDVPIYGDARLICVGLKVNSTESPCGVMYTTEEAKKHGLPVAPARFYEMRYAVLYAYNGDLPVFLGGLASGHHAGDVEHITVRVDAATDRVMEVYYGAHQHREGAWYPAQSPKADYAVLENKSLVHIGSLNASWVAFETHPVVYAAVNSHASYPRCGTTARHGWGRYLLPHDHNDGRGDVWFPHTVVPVQGSVFGAWGGLWGSNPPWGVTHQLWWDYEDPAGH